LEQARVDFAAGSGGGIDAPFFGDFGEGSRTAVGFHGGEEDGHGKPGVFADEPFGDVIGDEFAADVGEGEVVEMSTFVGRRIDECSCESLEREFRGQ